MQKIALVAVTPEVSMVGVSSGRSTNLISASEIYIDASYSQYFLLSCFALACNLPKKNSRMSSPCPQTHHSRSRHKTVPA